MNKTAQKNMTDPQRWAVGAFEFIENLALEEAMIQIAEEGYNMDDPRAEEAVDAIANPLIWRTIQEMARVYGVKV